MDAGQTIPAGRTSTRVKTKSQRAVESAHTDRLLARAKELAKAGQGTVGAGASLADNGDAAEGRSASGGGMERAGTAELAAERKDGSLVGESMAKSAGKNRGKASKKGTEVWCICKTADPGSMIECEECNDWFHFKCVDLTEEAAERIHTYICPPCSERTALESIRAFDITTFRSPSPPFPQLGPETSALTPLRRSKLKPGKASKGLRKDIKLETDGADGEGDAEDDDDKEGVASSDSEDESHDAQVDGDEDDEDEDDEHGPGSESDSDSSAGGPSERSAVRQVKKRRLGKVPPLAKPRTASATSAGPAAAASAKPASANNLPGPGPRRPSQASSNTTPTPAPGSAVRRVSSNSTASVPVSNRPSSKASTSKPAKAPRSGTGASSASAGAMSSARQFVLDKLTSVLSALFSTRKTADEVRMYAVEVESVMFRELGEVKDGKMTTGARYKNQFTLLQSSLNPSLQSLTLTPLLSSHLSPSQLAVLPSSRLASQARYDEDQAAQQEILRQTVRIKDQNADGGLRVGPDGFEKVEDVRERELQREREREERRRKEGERRREEREREEEERYGTSRSVPAPISTVEEGADRGGDAPVKDDGPKDDRSVGKDAGATDVPSSRAKFTAQTGTAPSPGNTPNTGSETPGAIPASPSGSLKRKASLITSNPPSPSKSTHKRPSFDLRSAWSGQIPTSTSDPASTSIDTANATDVAADTSSTAHGIQGHVERTGSGTGEQGLGVDQTVIDLSDVVGFGEAVGASGTDGEMAGEGMGGMDLDDDPLARIDEEERRAEVARAEGERYAAKPVVWRGRLTNPFEPSPHLPPFTLRLLAPPSRPILPAQWDLFFPHPGGVLATENRVATRAAIKFLESTRLAPSKEIICVGLNLEQGAGEGERGEWEKMVRFYVEKDRYPVLTVPSSQQHPAGAKEVYLIPLRPTDSAPSMTDLIDGFDLPSKREASMWIGMLPVNREFVGRYGGDVPAGPGAVGVGGAVGGGAGEVGGGGTPSTPARPSVPPDAGAHGIPPHIRTLAGGSGPNTRSGDWATPQKNELQALLGKINIPQITQIPTTAPTPTSLAPTPPYAGSQGGSTPMPVHAMPTASGGGMAAPTGMGGVSPYPLGGGSQGGQTPMSLPYAGQGYPGAASSHPASAQGSSYAYPAARASHPGPPAAGSPYGRPPAEYYNQPPPQQGARHDFGPGPGPGYNQGPPHLQQHPHFQPGPGHGPPSGFGGHGAYVRGEMDRGYGERRGSGGGPGYGPGPGWSGSEHGPSGGRGYGPGLGQGQGQQRGRFQPGGGDQGWGGRGRGR